MGVVEEFLSGSFSTIGTIITKISDVFIKFIDAGTSIAAIVFGKTSVPK